MRPNRTSIAPTLLRLALGSALVVSLAACADGGEDETPTGEETTASDPTSEDVTDETSEEPTDDATSEDTSGETGGLEDVPTADVGDCLVIADMVAGGGGGITELPTVDCAEDHDAQVFAVIAMPDGDYPGDDAVETAMTDGCTTAFEEFVGIPLEESALEADGLAPSEDTWAVGDREILCLAFYPDLQTTNESFEGAAI